MLGNTAQKTFEQGSAPVSSMQQQQQQQQQQQEARFRFDMSSKTAPRLTDRRPNVNVAVAGSNSGALQQQQQPQRMDGENRHFGANVAKLHGYDNGFGLLGQWQAFEGILDQARGTKNVARDSVQDHSNEIRRFANDNDEIIVQPSRLSTNDAVLERAKQALLFMGREAHAQQQNAPITDSKNPMGPSSWGSLQYSNNLNANLPLELDPLDPLKPRSPVRNTANIQALLQSRPCPPITTNWAVIKMRNISWDLSITDVENFLRPAKVHVAHRPPYFTQAVHIIINRATGKTCSDCFIEFPSEVEARRALESHHRGVLKGRVVTLEMSNQADLMRMLFARPIRDEEGNVLDPATAASQNFARDDRARNDSSENSFLHTTNSLRPGTSDGIDTHLSRDDINAILQICRNFKLHFSRKCAERPFENIISILCKTPWYKAGAITTMHRDHIFEMTKLSMESLRIHLSKDYCNTISPTLMERMARAGLAVPTFTEKQKLMLLNIANMECPPEMSEFVYQPELAEPPTSEGDTSSQGQIGISVIPTQPFSFRPSTSHNPSPPGVITPPGMSGESSGTASAAFPSQPKGNEQNQKDVVREAALRLSKMSLNTQDAPEEYKSAKTPTNIGAESLYPSPPEDVMDPVVSALPREKPPPPPTSSFYQARLMLLQTALKQSSQECEDLRMQRERDERTIAILRQNEMRSWQKLQELETLLKQCEVEKKDFAKRAAWFQQRLTYLSNGLAPGHHSGMGAVPKPQNQQHPHQW
ncbi:hypothetical protein HK102_005875 [Quaeritorhiza haematococci]|nr:hypothetical protein HK102_005875 [Quaeritorhiza haematococci]